MKHSDSLENLATALASAQAEMKAAPMNSTNPFLKNKFADLGAVIETARPILTKHGLALTQFPTSDERGRVGIENILIHKSGEWMSESIYMDVSDEKGKSAAQVTGSILTYFRRYSWAAIAGMYSDEDTDGNHPERAKQEQAEEVTNKPRSNFGITLGQAQAMKNKDGVLYTELDSVALAAIANNDKAPADKRMAATVILANRNQKEQEQK